VGEDYKHVEVGGVGGFGLRGGVRNLFCLLQPAQADQIVHEIHLGNSVVGLNGESVPRGLDRLLQVSCREIGIAQINPVTLVVGVSLGGQFQDCDGPGQKLGVLNPAGASVADFAAPLTSPAPNAINIAKRQEQRRTFLQWAMSMSVPPKTPVAYARAGRKLADPLTSNPQSRDGRIGYSGLKSEVCLYPN